MKTIRFLSLICLVIFLGCSSSDTVAPEQYSNELTIFFVNDVHSQIDNFDKVKHIVDKERSQSDVMVVCSGDLFSGNPVVDNYEEKGYPIIDIMNEIGFDAACLGNHEFDYGPEVLGDRIQQSNFPWLCANATAKSSDVLQPEAYTTLTVGEIKITCLGLIETNGSDYSTIPSSHPWRVANYEFEPAQNVIGNYSSLKTQEGSDLLLVLSHLGYPSNENKIGDFGLAQQYPFIDLIIGGHSHAIIDTIFNNTPVFQSGGYLNYLGKIKLEVKDKSIVSSTFSLIDLNSYSDYDENLSSLIDSYNDWPELYETIGVSEANHSTVIYEMTVAQIKQFLTESGSGFYYSGIQISKSNSEVVIRDNFGREIPEEYVLEVGINDYIPAVHSLFFPESKEIQPLTAAETIIAYLEDLDNTVNFSGCSNYFRY